MLFLRSFTLLIDTIEYEIFLSPISLHSKERPVFKSGWNKLEKLYFYNRLQDDEYKSLLQLENTAEEFISDKYIMNYGQDFEKYYLGSLHLDTDTKTYWGWEGTSDSFNEHAVKVLGDSLFNNPESSYRVVTLFTPTRASDINLSRGPMDIEG